MYLLNHVNVYIYIGTHDSINKYYYYYILYVCIIYIYMASKASINIYNNDVSDVYAGVITQLNTAV